MEKNTFDFWQDHSVEYLEMAFKADHLEIIANPDGYGMKTGDCGDTVEMFLTVDVDDRLKVSFNVNGCINTRACCNAVAQFVEGKTAESAWDVSPDDIIDYLKTLPADHYHCAELSVGALYLALSDYEKNKLRNWKRLYSKKTL